MKGHPHDVASNALAQARAKAARRGLDARFLERDARDLGELGEPFDTVLDCGLFHLLDAEDRAAFVAGLGAVLPPGGRYFMLCFSDRAPRGPHRLSPPEIAASFTVGWRVDAIEPTVLDRVTDPAGVPAWSVAVTRL